MPGALTSGSLREPVDRGDDGARGRLRDAAGAEHDDLRLARRVGIGDPVIGAAAAERLVQLARPVGGEHDDRRRRRLDRADLRDGDLVVGEKLEQERLELVVGAVDLVDQEHRAVGTAEARGGAAARSGTRRHRCPPRSPVALRLADGEQLARMVPLVERLRRVDALVALQADESRGRAPWPAPSRPPSCRRRARPRRAAACRAPARGTRQSRKPSSAR